MLNARNLSLVLDTEPWPDTGQSSQLSTLESGRTSIILDGQEVRA